MRDGTMLAADIFRPGKNGKATLERLPVLWRGERYHRAGQRDQVSITADSDSAVQSFLRYGYVVAVIDMRGTGASFGSRDGPFSREEILDAYDITEWLATQPWSSGKIGMIGRSYSGIIQYLAAASAPPHLVAIFPEMALFDLYDFLYPGGVFRRDFVDSWSKLVHNRDRIQDPLPVDADPDGSIMSIARSEHQRNVLPSEMFPLLPFRDSREAEHGLRLYQLRSPASSLRANDVSGIAIYHVAGWYDLWPKDALLWFSNLKAPQKILIGPWSHRESIGFDLAVEQRRWFDYWLKGIPNGIMDEPPIRYFTMEGDGGQWTTSEKWPVSSMHWAPFYLGGGKESASALLKAVPLDGAITVTADYTQTSGDFTRWSAGYGSQFGYSDMASNDAKGIVFTTPPLAEPLIITGHPVINVWISATTDDVDLVAYLELVDSRGVSTYVTEGVLRASHRAIGIPPYNFLGLPYHPSTEDEVVSLPGNRPSILSVDLHPTSIVVPAGVRIRLALNWADEGNLSVQKFSPPPDVTVHFGEDHPSHILLPLVHRKGGAESGSVLRND